MRIGPLAGALAIKIVDPSSLTLVLSSLLELHFFLTECSFIKRNVVLLVSFLVLIGEDGGRHTRRGR